MNDYRFIKLGFRVYAVRNKLINYVNPFSYGKDYYFQVIGKMFLLG